MPRLALAENHGKPLQGSTLVRPSFQDQIHRYTVNCCSLDQVNNEHVHDLATFGWHRDTAASKAFGLGMRLGVGWDLHSACPSPVNGVESPLRVGWHYQSSTGECPSPVNWVGPTFSVPSHSGRGVAQGLPSGIEKSSTRTRSI